MDKFIQIKYGSANIDRYYVRTSIKEALNDALNKLNNDLLDIGCGKMPYKDYILKNSTVKSYIGLDIETALTYDKDVRPNYTWDGITMPFEDNRFHCAIGTEVLEHCPCPEVVLKETFRVMKSGGVFFFTVPFLWPLHEVPHDEYRYTPWSLERHLRNAGFGRIEIKPLGGWHASMAQMLGLWVRRAPMTERKRKLYSRILMPVIKKLIKTDKYTPVTFTESQMITGLSGIAYKL